MADTPQHVAIIMDGNGRWARGARLAARRPVTARASRSVRRCVEECAQRSIRFLTMFAFSSENWSRPPDEVGMLMKLFLDAMVREVADLHRNRVRLRFIGDRERCSAPRSRAACGRRKPLTAREHRTHAAGGARATAAAGTSPRPAARSRPRWPRATLEAARHRRVAGRGARSRSRGIPDPDLLIRTGGELRISNFLLWNLAYAELYFTDRALARFRQPELSARARVLRGARAALRPHDRTDESPRPVSESLRKRLPPRPSSTALLLVGLFWLPAVATVAVLAIVVLMGAWEWSAFLKWSDPRARAAFVALVAVLLPLAWLATRTAVGLEALLGLALLWWLVALVWIVVAPRRVQAWSAGLAGLLSLVPAWLALMRLRYVTPHGAEWVLFSLVLVWIADIGAFSCGRRFGRRVSPRAVRPARPGKARSAASPRAVSSPSPAAPGSGCRSSSSWCSAWRRWPSPSSAT